MLYFPERMAKGDVPNVDFLHLYGPGSLHALMAWYELFGNTLAVERTFGLLQHVAIILALFTLARPWGRTAATLVGGFAVFYVLTPIGLTAMAWNGGLALTLWCAVFAVRSTYLGGRPQLVARIVAGAARRAGPDLPPRPRRRRGPRSRLDGVDPATVVAGGGHRDPGRAHAAVVPPGRRWATRRRGREWSSTRSSICGRDGRCPGRRRGATSTVRCRRSPRPSRRGGTFPMSAPHRRSSCGSWRCWPAPLGCSRWPLSNAAGVVATDGPPFSWSLRWSASASCRRACSAPTRPTSRG